MNKRIISLIVCIFLVLLIGGSILFPFKKSVKCGVLKIDGVDIANENVIFHSDYTGLPLTEVMKNLGIRVDWTDKITATITYENKKYTLNISKVSLIEAEGNANLLLPPPGGNRFYTVIEKELILDSNTLKSVMYQMGIKIDINISLKEGVIYISRRNN